MESVAAFKAKAVKLKSAVPVIAAIAVSISLGAAREPENKYDVLAKTLAPFVNVFAQKTKNPNRALTLKLRLETMTGMSLELAGAHAEVALQYPDKLRVRGPFLGEELTVCRDGQDIWMAPGSKLAPLLAAARTAKKLPKPDPDFRLAPFRLPVPDKQLVFLPALFQVRDAGTEPLDGAPCRVLDLTLMPELARSVGAGWSVRLWAGENHIPMRLALTRADWQISVRIDAVSFLPALPEATWQPAGQEDILKITPAQYQQLLGLLNAAR